MEPNLKQKVEFTPPAHVIQHKNASGYAQDCFNPYQIIWEFLKRYGDQ